jgi:hypothetical protein
MSLRAKFNLKDLFLSTTLICVGLAMAITPFSALLKHEMWYYLLLYQLLWLGAGALVGAGILLPFNKAAAGAVIGFVVQVVVFYTYFIHFKNLF